MPEFDAYLMVDWSANSKPAKGPDSIWNCLVSGRDSRLSIDAVENPATRHQASVELKDTVRGLVEVRKWVLVGFDFPFGYPAGFAAALRLGTHHLGSRLGAKSPAALSIRPTTQTIASLSPLNSTVASQSANTRSGVPIEFGMFHDVLQEGYSRAHC